MLLVVVPTAYRLNSRQPHEGWRYWDDSQYYDVAAGLWSGTLPPSDWSPGFAAFFAPFANPWVAKEHAFFGLRLVMTVLLATLVFLCARRFARTGLAIAAALWVTASPVPSFDIVVRTGSALVVAFALLAAGGGGRVGVAVAILACGVWIRPEFAPVVLLAVLVFVRSWRAEPRWLVPTIVVVAGFAAYSAVVPARESNRLFWAFGQHYQWTQYDLGQSADEPFRSDWRPVLERDFGEADSVLGAMRTNPSAFTRHIAHNIAIIPRELLRALAPGRRESLIVVPCVLFAVTLAAAAFGLARDRRGFMERLGHSRQTWSIAACSVGVLALGIVIRPRWDTLFALVPAVVLFCAAVVAAAFPALGSRPLNSTRP